MRAPIKIIVIEKKETQMNLLNCTLKAQENKKKDTRNLLLIVMMNEPYKCIYIYSTFN